MAAQTSGVVSLGPDLLGITVVSRDLAGAATRAMGDAASFCASQGRQAELLKIQVRPADYQLTFRCIGVPISMLSQAPARPMAGMASGSLSVGQRSAPVSDGFTVPSLASTRQRVGAPPLSPVAVPLPPVIQAGSVSTAIPSAGPWSQR